jgi:metal transporter CNNM
MTTMTAKSMLPARRISTQPNGFGAVRSMAVMAARLLAMTLSTAYAAPLSLQGHGGGGDEPEAEGADLWVLYVASFVLVISGGAFAGLTIA